MSTRKDVRKTDAFIVYGSYHDKFTADVWRSDGSVIYGLGDTQRSAFTDVIIECKKQKREMRRTIRALRWLRFKFLLARIFRRRK